MIDTYLVLSCKEAQSGLSLYNLQRLVTAWAPVQEIGKELQALLAEDTRVPCLLTEADEGLPGPPILSDLCQTGI